MNHSAMRSVKSQGRTARLAKGVVWRDIGGLLSRALDGALGNKKDSWLSELSVIYP